MKSKPVVMEHFSTVHTSFVVDFTFTNNITILMGDSGTGKTATSDQAEEVCAAIRECIKEVYDEATAEAIRIQYGGSMNAGNAAELLAKPDIDGGLVGGASLKPDFGKIVNYNK